MNTRYVLALAGLIIVIILVWGFLFYSSITGNVLFEEPINPNPSELPSFEPFPDASDDPSLSPPSDENLCEDARAIRSFVCEIYTDTYPDACGFWSGHCKGMREMCEKAQEHVETNCAA